MEGLAESPGIPAETRLFRLVPRSTGTAAPPRSRLQVIRSFLLRLDVAWTAVFFVFIVCVSVTMTSITRTQMIAPPVSAWHAVHNNRLALYRKLFDLELEKAHSIAATLMAANMRKPLPMESEKTLSVICSTFVTLDTEVRFRAVLAVSASQKETVACIRGGLSTGNSRTLTGYISHNSIVRGTYYVDNTTYEFAEPLDMTDVWAEDVQNISASMSASLLSRAGFQQSMQYYEGLIDHIDPRTLWFYFAKVPHMFYYNVPATSVARGLNLSASDTINDFAQVRIDGSALLPLASSLSSKSGCVIILVNASLATSDPLIFSTNFGQKTVNSTTVYSANAAGPLSYLRVSEVTDPLMKEGLRHVTFAPLQAEGYTATKSFVYRGAPALVTACTLTTTRGLILPIVFVSAQRVHVPPYIRTCNVSFGVIAAAIVVCTAVFWWFVHVSFSQPLEEMTQRMLGNLNTGHRTLFGNAGGTICVQLSEVQELIDTHNATVRRLRVIDAFIPAELRRHIRHGVNSGGTEGSRVTAAGTASPAADGAGEAVTEGERLVRQLLTVVSITIHPSAAAAGAASPARDSIVVSQSLSAGGSRHGARLEAAVDAAVHTFPPVNSGPFASPEALGHFLSTVEELCGDYHGVLHRFSPDSCVVHFGSTTRAHLTRKAARTTPTTTHSIVPSIATAVSMSDETRDVIAVQACAAVDARHALQFAMVLQAWTHEHLTDHMPRVTMLVDTSTFTCGRHRPRGSEQTLSVAFGRDVQRKLGHIPLKIGVCVAMTEETALLLRSEHQRRDAAGEVRQIPVESLHIGRPGFNADVVILYEALPGQSDGDEVWQRFRWCCFRGFSLMVRGNYAAALVAFKDIADISDLEPGLMPSSMRREAAASDVTGGAVSVQVQRLMRECVSRVARGDTRPFCRERCDPLGIDAVLQGVLTVNELPPPSPRKVKDTRLNDALQLARAGRAPPYVPLYPEAKPRHVFELNGCGERIRTVVGGVPDWLQDNVKLCWQVAPTRTTFCAHGLWRTYRQCLGAAGSLATLDVYPFRDVPRPVVNAIRNAPLGPMSDELRSATPVFGPTPQQRVAMRAVYKRQCNLQHPNLLPPLSYSTSVEGGAVILFEYFSGGTLRQVLATFPRYKPPTIARFLHGVLSGLIYLHVRHLAHGALHMDNVIVLKDGVCRLRGHTASSQIARKLFVLPRTCYVSPAMAAGALPTPACDMFCYGLMCMELMACGNVWAWAAVAEGGEAPPSEAELAALMAAAEQPFFDAVVAGRIVVNTALFDVLTPTNQLDADAHALVRACVSMDPSKRPNAHQMQDMASEILALRWPEDYRWQRKQKQRGTQK